jgi:hypothetical protein
MNKLCFFGIVRRHNQSSARNYPPVLHMYRQILRLAAAYPSIKRNSVREEIRFEFRQNRNEGDEAKLKLAKEKAIFGITHLRKYVFDANSPDWVVNLEQEPMPQQPSQRKKDN